MKNVERIERIKTYLKDKLTTYQMAEIEGISRSRIRDIINIYQLREIHTRSNKNKDINKLDRIKRYLSEGLSISQIAIKEKASYGRIKNIVYGEQLRTLSYKEKEYAKLVKNIKGYIQDGLGPKRIAKLENTNTDKIRSIIKKENLILLNRNKRISCQNKLHSDEEILRYYVQYKNSGYGSLKEFYEKENIPMCYGTFLKRLNALNIKIEKNKFKTGMYELIKGMKEKGIW